MIGVIYQASCPSYFCGEVDHRVMGGGSNYGSRIEVESRLIVEEVVFWRVWQIGSSVSGCWSVEYTCFQYVVELCVYFCSFFYSIVQLEKQDPVTLLNVLPYISYLI